MLTHLEILALDVGALAREIERHNRLYWDEAAPEIPDTLYDFLVERLRSLDPSHPVLQALDARPAIPVVPESGKAEHLRPMLSLEKCYSESELRRFFDRFRGPAFASHKVDGLALSLRYEANGRLYLAVTRGDGSRGDVVTANARAICDVPTQVTGLDGPVEVRGEVYLPLSTFRARYAAEFANPRNLAAGALKQKDPARTASYGLRFFAYDLLGAGPPTEKERRMLLERLGFSVVPGRPADAETGQAVFEALAADRHTVDFETDGIVFKVDDHDQHAALGENAHHPRWAIAYKYQGESGITILRAVEWNVSRTGAIPPVAVVDPVQLSGVQVTRASLHNLGIIETLARKPLHIGENNNYPLSPGARLLLTRRGGVIPHVEGIVEAGDATLHVPARCPSCDAPTARRDDLLTADHSDDCAVQRRRALRHFVSVIETQGLGPKLIEQLDALDLLRRPSDLFRLQRTDLIALDRFGEKSAENLLAAIEACRRMPADQLVAALGIPDVGRRVAQMLLAGVGSLEALRRATVEELQGIDGVGPAIAQSAVDGLASWSDELDALLTFIELVTPPPPSAPSEVRLQGLAFVFTGELTSMKRKEAQERVRAAGGTTPADVSRETRFVVIGDEDHARYESGWRSSKLKKAEKLAADGAACEVIPERRFLAMLGLPAGVES